MVLHKFNYYRSHIFNINHINVYLVYSVPCNVRKLIITIKTIDWKAAFDRKFNEYTLAILRIWRIHFLQCKNMVEVRWGIYKRLRTELDLNFRWKCNNWIREVYRLDYWGVPSCSLHFRKRQFVYNSGSWERTVAWAINGWLAKQTKFKSNKR